ncbi:MAG: thioredoxin domain-containing protein [Pseudolabrys sp.]|nr:thioredoxin domain-containing protein [Pseudolabrys sp.]
MTRRSIVVITTLVAVVIFAGSAFLYDRYNVSRARVAPTAVGNELIRPHSPIIGPEDARVTIVEFFDPSCEACRAFHPILKQILAAFPNEVRLVVRYTPFHQGSDEAVRILETARIQGKFESVLEALLARQPEWADHAGPDLNKAWEFARAAGLDTERARRDATSSEITRVLTQDMADVKTNNVRRTPTFFVNGKPLPSFGVQQLYNLVQSEVQRTRTGS